MLYILVLIPVAGALAAWFIRSNRIRPMVMPVVALFHLAIALPLSLYRSESTGSDWIMIDPIGGVVLITLSLLFACCSIYAVKYLIDDRPERPNRVICLSLLLSLSSMSLACISQHMGLLWVSVATSTVAMAPLIYFNRNPRSIEAAWKYLMIGSVGIGLALLGLYFLAYATLVAGNDATLMLQDLVRIAPNLDQGWLKAAFIFLLAGFGTKLGLAPMHTWKPDAYGETPGVVGALLAGALTNCTFLALLRVYQVVSAAGLDERFYRYPLIVLGLLSMGFAAAFLARQVDFKRMLAYSSVEHVGILALALGIGKGALFGMMLHLVGNGLSKGALFLSSGTLHRIYGGKGTAGMHGALRRLPWSGSIFLAGFLAVSAFPPFIPFLSEFSIAVAAFNQENWYIGVIFLLLLALVFLGMAPTVMEILLGAPPANLPSSIHRESFMNVVPPLVLLILVLVLGIWMPAPFANLLKESAEILSGGCK